MLSLSAISGWVMEFQLLLKSKPSITEYMLGQLEPYTWFKKEDKFIIGEDNCPENVTIWFSRTFSQSLF